MTAPKFRELKHKRKLVCVTAYDFAFAQLADEAGVDLILVGDSVGNTTLGYESTVPVTLSEMAHHVSAASKGVSNALLVGDLPLGSYGSSIAQAVDSAVQLVKAGAHAVKLEGAFPDEVRAITKIGIPVMGHLGFTPQSVNLFGGFKVQGKGEEASKNLLESAQLMSDAGCFGIVLELIPEPLAFEITQGISIPTIGIGAGNKCDGQVQVMHDLLGLTPMELGHARKFMDGRKLILEAFHNYVNAVRSDTI